jgi:hypothetical protein
VEQLDPGEGLNEDRHHILNAGNVLICLIFISILIFSLAVPTFSILKVLYRPPSVLGKGFDMSSNSLAERSLVIRDLPNFSRAIFYFHVGFYVRLPLEIFQFQ